MILTKFLGQLQSSLPNTTLGNQVYRALYKLIGDNVPVYIGSDKHALLEKAYAFNSQVYSVVSRIATRAAGIPLVLYRVKDEKEARKFRGLKWKEKKAVEAYRSKALEEVESHQILSTLERPNKITPRSELIEGGLTYLIMVGDCFIYGFAPDGSSPNVGKQNELVLLPSQYTQIVGGTMFDPIKGYKLVFDYEIILEAQRVTHIKNFNPFYSHSGQQLYGFSGFTSGRRSVTESNSGYDTAVAYYQHAGARGVLTKKEHGQMAPEQAQKLQEEYDKRYGKDKGKIIVTSASVAWTQIGLSPVDLNIIQSRMYTMRDICNLVHMPSQIMNDIDNQNYSTMKEARKAMITDAVLPKYDKFIDGLNFGFVNSHNTRAEKFMLDYDYNNIPELQADLEMLVNQLNTAWWLKPNEKRFAMGYEEDTNPAMNKYYIPSNLISLDDMEIEPEAEEDLKRMLNEVGKFGVL